MILWQGQVFFYPAGRCNKVPMFHLPIRKVTKKDGKILPFLYGMSGFRHQPQRFQCNPHPIPQNMAVSAHRVNLRGGSRYGEDWHGSMTSVKKQNVFERLLISAAEEYHINEKYTNKDKSPIVARWLNGGAMLLVVPARTAASGFSSHCSNSRVGVMDALRYRQKFTIGLELGSDYGTTKATKCCDPQRLFSIAHVRSGHKVSNSLLGWKPHRDRDDRVVPPIRYSSFGFALLHTDGLDLTIFIESTVRIDDKRVTDFWQTDNKSTWR